MKANVFTLFLLLVVIVQGHAAVSEGDIAIDFSLTRHGGAEGETISLYDYEGHVIILDFFAYWCGPCQTSSPKIEEEIADYYAEVGGTENDIPVTVIAVSVDNRNPGAVDSFIENAKLELVGLDETQDAWRQFSLGFIPHFAVVNGVADANFEQWEILHTDSGYRGSGFYKRIAESVLRNGPTGFEAWAIANIEDENARGIHDDSDFDGLSNLLEYACGTDPQFCESHSALEISREENGDYILSFTESKNTLELETLIQASSDLQTWNDVPENTAVREETQFDSHRLVTLTIPDNGVEKKFWRRTVRQLSQ